MRDDQKISFEDLFQMPLDDIDGKLEFEEGEEKRSGTDQFRDFRLDLHEAVVEYYVNCMKSGRIADNALRSIRIGYDSCKAVHRKLLRENIGWEMLFIIGRLGELTSECLHGMGNGNQLGIPKIIGVGPGGVQVLNGGDVPPEVMEQIKKFAMDMTKRIVEQDGNNDPGDLKSLLQQKPPAPPAGRKETRKTQEEISREADIEIEKALNAKNKDKPQNESQ